MILRAGHWESIDSGWYHFSENRNSVKKQNFVNGNPIDGLVFIFPNTERRLYNEKEEY